VLIAVRVGRFTTAVATISKRPKWVACPQAVITSCTNGGASGVRADVSSKLP
jgi:hypothetical protein